MTIVQYMMLGLASGALYVLLALGLVVIYRGSGVLNFAHGAYAMLGAFFYYELRDERLWGTWPATIVALLLVSLFGTATHFLVMRPLRRASALARLIATLGMLSVVTGIGLLRYGPNSVLVRPNLPQKVWKLHDIRIPSYGIILLGVATILAVTLHVLGSRTRVGLAVSASVESEVHASAFGWSPDLLAAGSWTLGAGLAGLAGIYITPLAGLSVGGTSLLILPALAVALLAGFKSYPLTLVGGVALGVAMSEMAKYVQTPGVVNSLPFFVIIVVLVLRGRPLPLRGEGSQRLPRLGRGIPRPKTIAAWYAIGVVAMLVFLPEDLSIALGIQFVAGVIILSIVVVTGYAGQLSLAQFGLAGFGAFVTSSLVARAGWPFALAIVAGIACAVPLGLIFAIPALRTRGVNLAVVTLGLNAALFYMVFSNADLGGGITGLDVGETHFLGINIGPYTQPRNYAVFAFTCLVLSALVVANVRRGRSGRRLAAIRANERGAASLGISVFGAKLYAFGLSAGIAGLGGILFAFSFQNIRMDIFDPLLGLNYVGHAVIGGVGYATGPFMGGMLAPGGVGAYLLNKVGSLSKWLILVGGILLIYTLISNEEGIVGKMEQDTAKKRAKKNKGARAQELKRMARLLPSGDAPTLEFPVSEGDKSLSVRKATVRFGGVTALLNVDFEVRPGEVVGLIGPNGAGKTTLIDAVTGFTRLSSGSIEFGDVDINRLPPHRRARAGMGRSFQNLELFEDLTVLENLQAASDSRDWTSYFTDLVWPGNPPLPPRTLAVIAEFGLMKDLNTSVSQLPYGKRRLVAIARGVANAASLIALDEPAAGLAAHEREELTDLIRRLAHEWGMAVLLVEHDIELVLGVCDRVCVLNFGQVIASGTAAEIRHNPAVIDAYLGTEEDEDEPAGGAQLLSMEKAFEEELT